MGCIQRESIRSPDQCQPVPKIYCVVKIKGVPGIYGNKTNKDQNKEEGGSEKYFCRVFLILYVIEKLRIKFSDGFIIS